MNSDIEREYNFPPAGSPPLAAQLLPDLLITSSFVHNVCNVTDSSNCKCFFLVF